MYKTLYFYNASTKIYDHSELVDVSDKVPDKVTNESGEVLNVTTIRPDDGLYTPRKFDTENQTWLGTPKEEWLAAHPVPAPEPSEQDKTNAVLMLQIAQNKAAQDQFNAQAMLAIATQNGGAN
ncbi:hypothetical protein [Lactiplantibacillus plantarum]|uniref:hypothetical protein n=1 Tax=Lactiplantibacillus plantarum TaxID=1590 RepID=UPI003F534599